MVEYFRAQCLLKVVEDERKAMRNIFWGKRGSNSSKCFFVP